MNNSLQRFQNLLRQLFQFDCADLDFGIYRILNYKRQQVEDFITTRLPEIVDEAFAEYAAADKAVVEQELEQKQQEILSKLDDQAIDERGQLRMFRETALGQQYLALQEKQTQYQVAEELKTRVYNDLFTFFSRYYEEGDFVSKRRYGRNESYAIPYNGEEVVLHWANKDQYYIKTGERFKTYRFKAGDFAVAFELRNASVEQNNVKGSRRYFMLAKENPVEWQPDAKTLTIFFEYRPLTEHERVAYGKTEQQKPQDKLNTAAAQAILEQVKDPTLKAPLARVEDGSEQTAVGKHLTRFTRKNTTDFFIHKDLRGFLRRELDFFVKSEVLLLDELVAGGEADLQRHVQRARVVRRVAEAIIDFVAQVEDFQKRLFEKKKFVVRTEYCATLDRVPEDLWDKVLANEAQVAEWRELYALDELLEQEGLFNQDLTKYFLRHHPTLVVDTRHFPDGFKWRLLASLDDLDDAIDGVLIKSENFQALNLLLEKHRERVKCIYIDPPFNTGTNEFLYRNNYLNSTWLCMLLDRVTLGREFLDLRGNIFVRIDHHGDFYIRQLLSSVFGADKFQNQIIIKRGRETAGTRGKLEIASEKLFWFSRGTDPEFHEIEIPRPVSQVQWTAFLMGGERHPRERVFLGKTLIPPDGQHFPLSQPKVDKLLDEYFLRLRCRNCRAIYFKAENDYELHKKMKKKANRYKFYDITADKVIHGVQMIDQCLECGGDEWRVDYLGAPTVNVSNLWIDIESYARTAGFFTENSEELLKRVVGLSSVEGEYILDFFLGSGTTTAVAQKIGRRWIGVEMGEYFEDITLARMKRVLWGDSRGISRDIGWKGGGAFKYHYVESYEDTLNNLELPREQEGQLAFEMFGDEYLLRYMLEFETQGSPCLLNLDRFKDPFAYRLKVQEGDETIERTVDLVETFNYLLGINVKKMRAFTDGERPYRAVLGQKGGKRLVIVWRPVSDLEDDEGALFKDKAFIEQAVLPTLLPGGTPDRLLVNGPCFVENAETIEPEFKRLMFAGVARW